MKLSILTAALQELTPRERREADPDLAIEEWLAFAAEIGAPNIELSCALHPAQSDVPAAALLDPVANTLDLRKPFTAARAARVESAMRATGVGLSELGYFDNMLAADDAARRVKHELMLRVFDAAVLLRCDAVVGFVGRNPKIGMDANLDMFEEVFIPLLREAKARGLTYLVEQCPMPGWNVTDAWHNNIAYAPGPWIALHRICERHGVGDQFRIHYDPSHAILMGQDSRSVFQYLQGLGLRLPDPALPRQRTGDRLARHCRVGLWRPDDAARRPRRRHAARGPCRASRTRGRSRRSSASTSCRARRATTPSRTCRTAPSTGWTTSSRRASSWTSIRTGPTWCWSTSIPRRGCRTRRSSVRSSPARSPSRKAIDEAAAAMYALQHEVLAHREIPVQGFGREAYRT